MPTRVDQIDIRERMRWRPDGGTYEKVRSLWIDHSKAEDARSLGGLVATLTEDCIYELIGLGHRWEGHDGARRFYTELLGAFPDIDFQLQDVVFGPQGVYEFANVRARWEQPWIGIEPDGEIHQWQNAIFFPWDPEAERFAGEKVMGGPGSPGYGLGVR